MLEAEGIRASVLGDQLYGAYGELPVLPTVWVMDDTLAAHADRLVIDFLRGSAARRHATSAGPARTAEKSRRSVHGMLEVRRDAAAAG